MHVCVCVCVCVCVQVKDFLRRFASIPDVLDLDHLTVSGDVTFGKDVKLRVCCNKPSMLCVCVVFLHLYSHLSLSLSEGFSI